MNEKPEFLGKIGLFMDVPPRTLKTVAAEMDLVYYPERHQVQITSGWETANPREYHGSPSSADATSINRIDFFPPNIPRPTPVSLNYAPLPAGQPLDRGSSPMTSP